MDVSSSGRLKKMGFNPDAHKDPEDEEKEESKAPKEELSETGKLRLARKPTQIDIDLEEAEELMCPGCDKSTDKCTKLLQSATKAAQKSVLSDSEVQRHGAVACVREHAQ